MNYLEYARERITFKVLKFTNHFKAWAVFAGQTQIAVMYQDEPAAEFCVCAPLFPAYESFKRENLAREYLIKKYADFRKKLDYVGGRKCGLF